MERDLLQSGDPKSLFEKIEGTMREPVSQIVAYMLTTESAGQPAFALAAYEGGLAELVSYTTDGAVLKVKPLASPKEVIDWSRRLRRLAQELPQAVATVNIIRGSARLVA